MTFLRMVVICISCLSLVRNINIVDAGLTNSSEILEGTSEPVEKNEKDIRILHNAIASLSRPQFDGIPTLVQKLVGAKGPTEYYFPGELSQSQVVITTNSSDGGKEIVIFPMGENGFGRKAEKTYVVLRKRKNSVNETYFLNIAYLRKSGKQTIVEWSTVEQDQFRKSALEVELCRKEECEFPEWIIGTCQIVGHSCAHNMMENSMKSPNSYDTTKMLTKRHSRGVQGSDTLKILENSISNKENRRKKRNDQIAEYELKSTEGNEAILVPSSLDLLIRPKKSTDDGFFKNSVLKTKDDNEYRVVNENLKCTQCQMLGDFFWDLEERSLEFSAQVGKRIREDVFTGQASSVAISNVLKILPNIPFVGFGNCNYSLEMWDKPKSKEIDDIIEFYLGTLNKDCDPVAQSDMRGWLTSKLKFLHIEPDLTLSLISTSQLLKTEILNSEEFGVLMSVLLVSEYTNIYREQRTTQTTAFLAKNSTWILNPVGLRISKTTKFLTKLFLRLISTVRQVLDNHLIKSLRTIIRYVKDKFLSLLVEKRKLSNLSSRKLMQDGNDTSTENSTKELCELNFNDLNQIMALKEFVLYGLGPVFKSGTPTAAAFASFYRLNQKRIEYLLKAFDT